MENRVQISSEVTLTSYLSSRLGRLLENIDIKFISILLMLYVSCQLIFGLENNVIYSNIINILLLGSYCVVAIYRKHKGLYLGNISVYFTLFSLVCIWSAGWAADWTKSVSWFRSLIIININILLFYDIIARYNLHKYILYGFIIGIVFNQAIALDIINYHNPYQKETRRFVGTVANPNILSTIVLLGLISSGILMNLTKSSLIKIFHGFNITLCFYLIFLSMSRKGIAIAFLLLTIFLFKNIRSVKGIVGLSVFILAIVYYGFNFLDQDILLFRLVENIERIQEGALLLDGNTSGRSGSGGARLELLKLGKELFIQSPFWGHGYNNFSHFTGFHYSHNNYVEILTGTGLVGFFLFYFTHFKTFLKSRKLKNFDLKILLFAALVTILIADLGTVSYLKKHTMTMIVFLDAFTNKLNWK